jgi:hypothetical protein
MSTIASADRAKKDLTPYFENLISIYSSTRASLTKLPEDNSTTITPVHEEIARVIAVSDYVSYSLKRVLKPNAAAYIKS